MLRHRVIGNLMSYQQTKCILCENTRKHKSKSINVNSLVTLLLFSNYFTRLEHYPRLIQILNFNN